MLYEFPQPTLFLAAAVNSWQLFLDYENEKATQNIHKYTQNAQSLLLCGCKCGRVLYSIYVFWYIYIPKMCLICKIFEICFEKR